MITFQEFVLIAESSEKRRALASRGPQKGYAGTMKRIQNSNNAALSKAGFRKTSLKKTGYGRDSYSTNSPTHETNITSYKNQSHYANVSLPIKYRYGGGVIPSKERVRFAKHLRRQMGGTRTPRKVHDVSIFTREDIPQTYGKNDPTNLISRGKSFKQELSNVPHSLWRARSRGGDIVTGTPSGIMPGEDEKKGAKIRAKLYKKVLGGKSDNVTGRVIGRHK